MIAINSTPLSAKRLWFARVGRREWLMVELADGRAIGMPVSAFPSLAKASAVARTRYRKIGGGVGFHWPALDLDLSVDGIAAGRAELRRLGRARRAA